MIKRLQLELAFETLRITISFRLSTGIREASIHLPKPDSRLKVTISSFRSRMRRPYAIPSAIDVTNLMTSLCGVTYIKVGILTAEGLVLTR